MADFGGAELDAFRAEAREWLEANFPKSLAKDQEGQQAALMGAAEGSSDQKRWKARMGAKGWGVPTWPAAYGGGGPGAAGVPAVQLRTNAPVASNTRRTSCICVVPGVSALTSTFTTAASPPRIIGIEPSAS